MGCRDALKAPVPSGLDPEFLQPPPPASQQPNGFGGGVAKSRTSGSPRPTPARALTVAWDLQGRVVTTTAFLKLEAAVRGCFTGAPLQVKMRWGRGRSRRRLRGGWLRLELVKGAPRPGAALQRCRQVLLPRAVAGPAFGVPKSLSFGSGRQKSCTELVASWESPKRRGTFPALRNRAVVGVHGSGRRLAVRDASLSVHAWPALATGGGAGEGTRTPPRA